MTNDELRNELNYAKGNGANLERKIDLIMEGIAKLLPSDPDPFCERQTESESADD
jgi:hypothetical protein